MSIIIEDLDGLIISFLDLPEYVALMQTNNYYYQNIKSTKLITEWNTIKQKNKSLIGIFNSACKKGFIIYAKSLVNRYGKNIHRNFDVAFALACLNGHFEIAKWLIDLGENHGYRKIKIKYGFFCFLGTEYRLNNNYFEIAKWLIDLGENHVYKRINIHANNNYAFRLCCYNGNIKIAKWLIDLGEHHGYGRVNIHEVLLFCKDNYIMNNAFKACCDSYPEMARWLIDLGENHGYGKYDDKIVEDFLAKQKEKN